MGGRLTLTKDVLGSLPTLFFSLLVALVGVINKLEKIRRQFLCVDQKTKKKDIFELLNKVVTTKEGGGLD